ncbi:hypothetical protein JaAD80_21505 [Janthinobacterium sp. AD80]|nr:hypothetical protein JaAD80_21505 [Janthinobacterium sp. AD80]
MRTCTMFSSEAFCRTMPYQAPAELSISSSRTSAGASSNFGPMRSLLSMSDSCQWLCTPQGRGSQPPRPHCAGDGYFL